MAPVLRLGTDHAHRLLHAADVVKRQLFVEIVIHHRIRDLRPAVQHIPPYNPRPAPFFQARLFNEKFLRLRLADLRQHGQLFQAFAFRTKHIPHLVHHQLVAVVPTVPDAQRILGVVGIPCVILDGPKVLFRDKLPQRRHRRTAVIPDLADEMRAGMAVKVPLEIVARPPVVLLGHIQIARHCERNIWRGRQKEAEWVM